MDNFDINSHWVCVIENETQLLKLELIFPLYFDNRRFKVPRKLTNHSLEYPCYLYNGYSYIEVYPIDRKYLVEEFKLIDVNLLLNYNQPITHK